MTIEQKQQHLLIKLKCRKIKQECVRLRYLATLRSDSNSLVRQSLLGATDTLMKLLPLMLPLMKIWNFRLPTMRLLEWSNVSRSWSNVSRSWSNVSRSWSNVSRITDACIKRLQRNRSNTVEFRQLNSKSRIVKFQT